MKTKQPKAKNRFHHIGILVKDVSKAINKYTKALEISKNKIVIEVGSYMTEKGETEEFKYAFIPLAEEENNFIELVEPTTPGPTTRYLEKHGEGLFHLAFKSTNIAETIKNFENAGILVVGATPTEEVLSVFLHPRFAHGVLIQVLKKGIFDGAGRISQEILKKKEE